VQANSLRLGCSKAAAGGVAWGAVCWVTASAANAAAALFVLIVRILSVLSGGAVSSPQETDECDLGVVPNHE
jgi:hypothetical protein